MKKLKCLNVQQDGCITSAKYKYNIVKHLKSCYSVNIRKKSVAQNKICDICGKEFAQKSNRDRHVNDFHSTNVAEFDIDESGIPEFEELPTMTATIFSHHEVINLSSEATQQPTSSTSKLPSVTSSKQSRLESIINKLTNNIDYSSKFNQCVVEKLKKDLVNNKRKAVAYMRECFDSILDDDDFLKWLGTAVGFKPYRLKRILSDKKFNRRNSQLPQSIYQDIYDFWLSKSITLNYSTNNIKRITKKDFLQQYKEINDSNVMENEVMLKNGSKNIYSASKMIYVESIRKLSDEFNSSHTPVSMSVFFSYKPFYCVRPSEKEKQSCVRINCNNPHLLLKAINTCRNSNQSLTSYIHALKSGKRSHRWNVQFRSQKCFKKGHCSL